MSGQPNQETTEAMEVDPPSIERAPEPEVTELPVDKRSIVELSSNTDTEGCEAYISRTVELLASVESATMSPNVQIPVEIKASVSDPVAVTPGLNELIPEEQMPEGVPRVVFLDKPDIQVTPSEATITEQNTLEKVEPSEQPIMVPESVAQTEQSTEGDSKLLPRVSKELTGGLWTTGPIHMMILVLGWKQIQDRYASSLLSS